MEKEYETANTWMTREKVNLMEMFMFSLKFDEANTMKWLSEWIWV